ncbi:DNA polymerase III subunit gamma/tau [Peptoniphilus equinus]|uniref:DNA-directed DNA polymerase n=1 Tax=Peptoniphilus equinus TaxID=3016343 RepID=A0ABY7QUM6_9FIRM|nr:DNA polymerase III subunit gamma/tau [Peptoniphilus equinus]WBW50494.1 DNA polymerase III subunit gamma/tau [Peptoniphilus equinus]
MYQALYRKYRSKTFDELVGQDSITHALKNQVVRGDFSHAYLFSGTRGTGKTSAAKILARAVNCLNPQSGNPCNECEACRSILADRVMDVVEMDAASNNGVDDIRELKDRVVYPPQNLKYKVYIIDEVHMLSKGAFNALLKILEEPPHHLIFILATTEPEKIPATILSRLQRYHFKRIGMTDIVANLRAIAQQENRRIDDEVLALVAQNADGAMRDALSIMDQLFSFDGHITYEIAIEILGIAGHDALFELSDGILMRNLTQVMDVLRELYDLGKDMSVLFGDLISHFRNVLVIGATEDGSLINGPGSERYLHQARLTTPERLIDIIRTLTDAYGDVRYAMDKRIVMEMCCIELCTRQERAGQSVNETHVASSAEPIVQQRPEVRSGAEPRGETPQPVTEVSTASDTDVFYENDMLPADEAHPAESQTPPSAENTTADMTAQVTTADFKAKWPEVIASLKRNNKMSTAVLLDKVRDLKIEHTTAILIFDVADQTFYNISNRPDNIKAIQTAVDEHFEGLELRVQMVDINGTGALMNKLMDLVGEDNIEIIEN